MIVNGESGRDAGDSEAVGLILSRDEKREGSGGCRENVKCYVYVSD